MSSKNIRTVTGNKDRLLLREISPSGICKNFLRLQLQDQNGLLRERQKGVQNVLCLLGGGCMSCCNFRFLKDPKASRNSQQSGSRKLMLCGGARRAPPHQTLPCVLPCVGVCCLV